MEYKCLNVNCWKRREYNQKSHITSVFLASHWDSSIISPDPQTPLGFSSGQRSTHKSVGRNWVIQCHSNSNLLGERKVMKLVFVPPTVLQAISSVF